MELKCLFICPASSGGEREDSQAWLVSASNAAVQRVEQSEREREMKYAEKQHVLQAMNDVDSLCQESERAKESAIWEIVFESSQPERFFDLTLIC